MLPSLNIGTRPGSRTQRGKKKGPTQKKGPRDLFLRGSRQGRLALAMPEKVPGTLCSGRTAAGRCFFIFIRFS